MTVPAPNYNTATNCSKTVCGLTTVVIPKSKGGDWAGQPVPPTLGAYQNTIVVYEKTGSVYIYDENGVYTSLTGQALVPVIEELENMMKEVTNTVNNFASELTQERTERVQSDVDIRALIEALQQQVNNEASARENAEKAINDRVDKLEGEILAAGGDVTAETDAREAADAELQSQIDQLKESKQDKLESGVNLKTINGQSLLGSGNIDITAGGGGGDINVVQSPGSSTTDVMSQNAVTNFVEETAQGFNEALDQVNAKISAISIINVVQEMGQSTEDVMSQKAVTDIVGDIASIVAKLDNGAGV